MALPRCKLSDYIGKSTDSNDILHRLRHADLLLADSEDSRVIAVIEQLVAHQVAVRSEYKRHPLQGIEPTSFELGEETGVNHLMPIALDAHWNAKARKWWATRPHIKQGIEPVGEFLEAEAILDQIKQQKGLREDMSDSDALEAIRQGINEAKLIGHEYDHYDTLVSWIRSVALPIRMCIKYGDTSDMAFMTSAEKDAGTPSVPLPSEIPEKPISRKSWWTFW